MEKEQKSSQKHSVAGLSALLSIIGQKKSMTISLGIAIILLILLLEKNPETLERLIYKVIANSSDDMSSGK